jgi:hypothetical protein
MRIHVAVSDVSSGPVLAGDGIAPHPACLSRPLVSTDSRSVSLADPLAANHSQDRGSVGQISPSQKRQPCGGVAGGHEAFAQLVSCSPDRRLVLGETPECG